MLRSLASATALVFLSFAVLAQEEPHTCIGSFQTVGATKSANGDWIVHVTASSHIDHGPGCFETIGWTCPACPNNASSDPPGYGCSNDCTNDLNVTCWTPGTYAVHWTATCGWSRFLGICEHYGPSDNCDAQNPTCTHQDTTFTVPVRKPTVSLDYDAPNHRLKITYDYDGLGEMRLVDNEDDQNAAVLSGPECLHSSGVCYYDIGAPVCFHPHTYTVKIRSCGMEPWKLSGKTIVSAPESACPIKYDSTNCTPNQGLGKSCPVSPNLCPGGPVHSGSGDVSLTIPLFTLAQSPLPLAFDVSYHSLASPYPNAITTSLGNGWTHNFNASLRPTDTANEPGRLLLVTPHGERFYFDQATTSYWVPIKPRSSRETIVLSGSEYILRSLDGSEMHFDKDSGHWTITRDRWANSIFGGYTNGTLTTITDSVGRVVTLGYTSGALTSVQLPSGDTWHFGYNGELTSITDPGHSSAWRTFQYQNDSHGVARLLTYVRDAASVVLEQHDYDTLDRGTTSVSAGGRDAYTIQYDTPTVGQVRVSHQIDGAMTRVSTLSIMKQDGQYLPTEVDGVCPSCGLSSDTQTFTYDTLGQVVTRMDGSGHSYAFVYDGFRNIVSSKEAVGTSDERTTTYDFNYPLWPEFVTRRTEPSATGAGVKTTDYTWSSNETVFTVVETGKLNSTDAAVSYATTQNYDSHHRLISTDGPRTDASDVTTNAYYPDNDTTLNRRGRLHTVTDALSHVTTFDDYDVFGTAKTITDPNGVVTKRETDARGRTTSTTSKAVTGDANEPADYVSGQAYDARDRLTEATSARGLVTRFTYEDGSERLTDTTLLDSSGNEQERHHVVYDLTGQKTSEEDQVCSAPAPTCSEWIAKRQQSYVYNTLGRMTEVHHGSDVVIYAYNGDGLLTSVEDENHTATDTDHATPNTTYGYDALHRLTTVTQTLRVSRDSTETIATSYHYDPQDNLGSVTDPNGNITSYSYDDFHRLQKQVSPVTGTTTYAYDPAGNLTDMIDANGAHIVRTYDALGRVLTAQSTLGSTESVVWTYDNTTAGRYGIGRLDTMTDPTGTTTYSYDRRGLLRAEDKTGGGATYTTRYGYDQDGNRKSITYPSGRAVSYTFDFAGRPITAASGSTNWITSASYLPFGPLTALTYGNGTVKTMRYDDRYRPSENMLTVGPPNQRTDSGPTLADYVYAEDSVGNITQIHDAIDASFDRDFGYDDLNRLTSARTGPSLWMSAAYTYDAMGNILSRSFGIASPDDGRGEYGLSRNRRASGKAVVGQVDTMSFAYIGSTPKLASVNSGGIDHPVAYDNVGNEIQNYDQGGHPTQSGPTRLYSPRNLLSSMTDNTAEVTAHRIDYGYDGRGVRVSRAESPTPSGTATRYYFYSPELHLLESTVDDAPNVWGSRRAATMTPGLAAGHEYIWFNGESVAEVGPPRTSDVTVLSRRPSILDATDTFYTFTDHLGTPLIQTDISAHVVWRAEYEPYGNVWMMRAGARTDQPLRLPGQELAMSWEGAEENYNIFRWYRAGWGRYTQADPIGLSGGTNLYGYAGANPLAYADPFGLISQSELDKMDCCQLQSEIMKARKELRRLKKNQLNPAKTTAPTPFQYWLNYANHLQKWAQFQKRLSDLLDEYDDKNCNNGLPQDINDWATQDYPDFDWNKVWDIYKKSVQNNWYSLTHPPTQPAPMFPGLPVGTPPVFAVP